MKPFSILLLLLASALQSCVQPANDKTVVHLLDVSNLPNVQQVGLRGRDKPLSWNEDLLLTPVVKDSLYRAIVTTHTGFLITKVKFTVNSELELPKAANRRIEFSSGDTTVYRARFGVAGK